LARVLCSAVQGLRIFIHIDFPGELAMVRDHDIAAVGSIV